jgi:hypothetical protein
MYGVLRRNRTGLVYSTSKNKCLYHYALYSLLRRSDFDRDPVHVEFMVNKVTMREVCLPVLQFSSVSNIPPVSHTHISIHLTFTVCNLSI